MTTTILIYLNAIICGLIAMRVISYRRQGATHRPLASLLAYLIAVASGGVAILNGCGYGTPAPGDVFLHAVLLAALIATRGNVVELFHSSARNPIIDLIRGDDHATG
jgi:hypothetical protein